MKNFISFLLLLAINLGLYADENGFIWSSELQKDSYKAKVTIKEGYYLYYEMISFEKINDFKQKELVPVESPQFIKKKDSITGDMTKILPAGEWVWEFSGKVPQKVEVSYQGCRKPQGDTSGICYSPETLTLIGGFDKKTTENIESNYSKTSLDDFKLIRMHEGTATIKQFVAFLKGDNLNDTSQEYWQNKGILVIILLTILGGIGLNLTPCVLPMIPVNLAIIGANNSNKNTGFLRGLAYGIGMAIAYGILGIVVVLGGAKFGSLNSSSTFNFIICAIFLILSLAMFGIFNLDFSSQMSKVKFSKLSATKSIGALLLGAISALLAGACVAPVVIGVLLLATNLYNSGNIAGLFLPLLLGIGMALPWPLVGAGLSILPKPGEFMNKIKTIFAIIILLAATYYGYIGYNLSRNNYNEENEFKNLELKLQQAKTENKNVLIDFWATWCKNCSQMENDVLSSNEVKNELDNYIFIKFQAEKLSDIKTKNLLKKYNISGLPTYIILGEK